MSFLTIRRLSPYFTAHVNRFGAYRLNLDRKVPPPEYRLAPRPKQESC